MNHLPLFRVVACSSLIPAVLVLAACGDNRTSSGPNAADAPSPSAVGHSTAPEPATFTSRTYGYTTTLPPQWTSIQAYKTWDGESDVSHDSGSVDQFIGTSLASSWVFAAPWKRGLAAYTRFLLVRNVRFHGDTCPARPQGRKAITVGGAPGVWLAYDCGILINLVGTVHHGVGYTFGFRDPAVQAAGDPHDRKAFLQILHSVRFGD